MPPEVQDGAEGREEKETKVKGGQGRWAEDTLQEGWATPLPICTARPWKGHAVQIGRAGPATEMSS